VLVEVVFRNGIGDVKANGNTNISCKISVQIVCLCVHYIQMDGCTCAKQWEMVLGM